MGFKNRLEVEKEELDDKLQKLNTFINSEDFIKLDKLNKHFLSNQLVVMRNYSDILDMRLELLLLNY